MSKTLKNHDRCNYPCGDRRHAAGLLCLALAFGVLGCEEIPDASPQVDVDGPIVVSPVADSAGPVADVVSPGADSADPESAVPETLSPPDIAAAAAEPVKSSPEMKKKS